MDTFWGFDGLNFYSATFSVLSAGVFPEMVEAAEQQY
jgi:hypothetical protein